MIFINLYSLLTYLLMAKKLIFLIQIKFVSSWEKYDHIEANLGESQGLILENGDFIVYSGFNESFFSTTRNVYAYDTKNVSSTWRIMDKIPLSNGMTHCAFANKGNILYSCGGYVGKHPGPTTSTCLKYTHTNPSGKQWEYLPNLPEPRAGGGLVLDSISNTLLYGTGASRPNPITPMYTLDHSDVWELNLNDVSSGWQIKPIIPYKGNHIGSVTVQYKGMDRHYFVGGQLGEQEKSKNLNTMYEWIRSNTTWSKRTSLPIPRGHFSSSIIPYKECGFIIVGGRTNEYQFSEITYYDIELNNWTKIGDLPYKLNTPVCDIINNMLYCQTGSIEQEFSWRRQII